MKERETAPLKVAENTKKENVMAQHRMIDTAFGEVMVDESGDCYIGDCYDTYLGTIYHRDVLNASNATLANKIETMLNQCSWSECEVAVINQ